MDWDFLIVIGWKVSIIYLFIYFITEMIIEQVFIVNFT